MNKAQWLLLLVTAIGAGVSLWAASSSRRSANEAAELVTIEREKLRHIDEPSFRARFIGHSSIEFEMVSGPMAVCEVTGMLPIDGKERLVDLESPFRLGYMQPTEKRRIKALVIPGTPRGGVRQQLIVFEVTPQDGKEQVISVVAYCDVPKPLRP